MRTVIATDGTRTAMLDVEQNRQFRDRGFRQSFANYISQRVNLPLLGNVNRGLTNQRIDRFERFVLDESTYGHKCLVCQDDPVIGTRMVRLDCHVDHVFCEQCAVPWFESHNTCPTCRQAFS